MSNLPGPTSLVDAQIPSPAGFVSGGAALALMPLRHGQRLLRD
jgi:hypothetical protein